MTSSDPDVLDQPPLAPPQPSLLRGVLTSYLVLQLASAAAFLILWGGLRLLESSLWPGGDPFSASWAAVFVLLPAGFLPVFLWWSEWTNRRFGRHPRWWRVVLEVAFAVNVVGGLLLRGIA